MLLSQFELFLKYFIDQINILISILTLVSV